MATGLRVLESHKENWKCPSGRIGIARSCSRISQRELKAARNGCMCWPWISCRISQRELKVSFFSGSLQLLSQESHKENWKRQTRRAGLMRGSSWNLTKRIERHCLLEFFEDILYRNLTKRIESRIVKDEIPYFVFGISQRELKALHCPICPQAI